MGAVLNGSHVHNHKNFSLLALLSVPGKEGNPAKVSQKDLELTDGNQSGFEKVVGVSIKCLH